MRNSSRWLLGLALASASLFALASDTNTLLVGEHKLTDASLAKALIGVGKVLGKDDKGYYRVAPLGSATLSELRAALKKAGTDLVFDGDADTINRSNYFSVRKHRAYLSGANLITTGKAKTNDFYQALEYYLSVRTDPVTGEMSRDEYIKAADHRDQMPAARMDMIDPSTGKDPLAPVGSWGTVGPRALAFPYQQYYGGAPLSGRKNGVHESVHNGKIYVASAGGGIWASTDNAITFSAKSNSWKFLHTTCVTTDPTNGDVVYAGTGDYYGFFTAQTFGIMKSSNAGATWTNLGAANFGGGIVTRIQVDPNTPTTVLALVAGGGVSDIWRSTDSGLTWAATNAVNSNWEDIERSASGITFAACGASGKKLAWSNTGGASWNAVNGIPAAAGGTLWDVAISPNVFDRWYLICSNRKVYRIENATSTNPTWTDITAAHDAGISNPSYNWSQSSYDMYIECGDDGAEDIVYTGLISVEASDDNGATWADIARSFETNSKMHNDQHCYEVDPDNGLWGIAGGDGGAWGVVYNPATNTASFTSLNDDIIDQQCYTGVVHPTNTSFVETGTQDNATPASRGNGAAWSNLYAGDGAGVGFDLNNPARHYTGSQNGGVFRYDTDFDTTPVDLSTSSNLFIAPLICAGSYAVHGGTGSIKLNLNGTSGWTFRATGGGNIRHLEKSKFTDNKIYTGATNGDMYRHIISANTTTKIDGATLPNVSVGGFFENYYGTDSMFAGVQRVGVAGQVYRSGNVNTATPVWTNYSGTGVTSLPLMPVNDVEQDPWNATVIYAATDVGVFMSPDYGLKWYNMNAMGLPNVHVNELWMYDNGATKYLYAFTFGRGVWRIPIGQRFVNTFTLNKTSVYGGETVVGNVGLNGSASQNCACSVTDSSSNVITPGVSGLLIPQGSTARSFNIPTTNPTSSQVVTLTARMYANEAAGSRTATLNLYPIPNFVYTSSVDNVYGGNAFFGTVNLGAPAAITTTIYFSDSTGYITSPVSSSISVGGTSRSVVLTTATVPSTINATISARIATLTRTDTVAVHPKPVLDSIGMNPNPVKGGLNSTGTVSLVAAGLGGNISVALTDSSALVAIPTSVTILGGNTSANFTATTLAVNSSVFVSINASYNGVTKTVRLRLDP